MTRVLKSWFLGGGPVNASVLPPSPRVPSPRWLAASSSATVLAISSSVESPRITARKSHCAECRYSDERQASFGIGTEKIFLGSKEITAPLFTTSYWSNLLLGF